MSLARISEEAQSRIKRETAWRDDSELLGWLEAQGVDFIGFTNGSGLDIANSPLGLRAALIEARQDARTTEPIEQGDFS